MTVNLASGFLCRGYRVDILVCRRGPDGVAEIAVPAGARVIDQGVTKPIRGVPGLARYLKREKPLALVATMTHVCIAALLARRLAGGGVCVCRQVNTLSRMFAGTRGYNRWLTLLMARLLFPHGETVAVSHGVADDLAYAIGMDRERVSVIYEPGLGRDIDARLAQRADHPWFAEGEVPVFLAAGRLAPVKGFDVLLDAFARLTGEVDARLLILGEGPERGALEARTAALGLTDRVAYAGYVPNVLAYMNQCAAFVMPSRWEGLGVVLLEALYVGAPIIATDCPHGPREILKNGRFGTLVPVDDAQALSVAMKHALSAERPRHFPELESWLSRFKPDVAVADYVNLIESAVARQHGQRRGAPGSVT